MYDWVFAAKKKLAAIVLDAIVDINCTLTDVKTVVCECRTFDGLVMMLDTGKQSTHKSGQSPLPSSSFEREPNRSLNFRNLGTVLSINLTQYTKTFEMQAIRFVPFHYATFAKYVHSS